MQATWGQGLKLEQKSGDHINPHFSGKKLKTGKNSPCEQHDVDYEPGILCDAGLNKGYRVNFITPKNRTNLRLFLQYTVFSSRCEVRRAMRQCCVISQWVCCATFYILDYVQTNRRKSIQSAYILPWRNVADCCLDIVWNPLNEVAAVFVLYIQHLFIDFSHRHPSTEDGGYSQVSTVTWVACRHHVLGVKHLLSQLWNCHSAVLLTAAWRQWSETRHEEMKTWEWNHVDCQLTKIGVQLPTTTTNVCDCMRDDYGFHS